MSNQGKKVIGIYIDNNSAYILAAAGNSTKGEFHLVEKIEIDDHKDDIYKNDKVDLNKEKQELRKTYKEIETHANNMDVIYIFGPGKAQEQLKNHLEDNHHYKSKEIALGTSGQINTKQMADHLEKHFN
jgi:stalled ribosome rescue protein Dom34